MRRFLLLAGFALAALGLVTAEAAQPESPVACSEGNEPLVLKYGDHTTGCEIGAVTDRDRFSFVGATGDDVRINVSARGSGNYLDPRVEVRDPGGSVIADQNCLDSCSFSIDLTLSDSGTYLVSVEDLSLNETGAYQLQVERIPPLVGSRLLPYDLAIDDAINQTTDLDFFQFQGVAGTQIRINVAAVGSGNWLDPRVEVRDPGGSVIADQNCTNSCSFSIDLSLSDSGAYLLSVEDLNLNDTSTYQLNLQCVFGSCPPNFARALIDLSPTSGLITSELGDQAIFEVVLNGAPSADVLIDLSSSDASEGEIIDPPARSLTFTPANWDIPQQVTVRGVDDPFADGPQAYSVLTAPAVSGDLLFDGKDPDDVSVTNLDDEGACENLDVDVDGNGNTDALTDGLLVIRYLYGFRGDTLIGNAVGDGCTRCTAAEIEAYLELLVLP